MSIDVSVIIPTLGKRLSNLSTCLGSLVNQSYKDFEVIIVNDGGRRQPLKELAEKYGKYAHTKLIHRKGKGGAALARNIALATVKGEIVATMDDDCIASSDWLKNLVRNYADNDLVGGVGGPSYAPGEAHIPKSIKVTWYGELITDKSVIREPIDVAWLRGCNASYRLSVLKEVGGYDANFGIRSNCEDLDVSFAVYKRGYRLIFDPEAWVIHCDLAIGGWKPIKGASVDHPRWHYWRSRNHMYLACKHMNNLGGVKCIPGVAGYSILKCIRYSRSRRSLNQQISKSMLFSILGSLDGMMCGILRQPIRFYGI